MRKKSPIFSYIDIIASRLHEFGFRRSFYITHHLMNSIGAYYSFTISILRTTYGNEIGVYFVFQAFSYFYSSYSVYFLLYDGSHSIRARVPSTLRLRLHGIKIKSRLTVVFVRRRRYFEKWWPSILHGRVYFVCTKIYLRF